MSATALLFSKDRIRRLLCFVSMALSLQILALKFQTSTEIARSFKPSTLVGKLEDIFIGTKITRKPLCHLKYMIVQVPNFYSIIVPNIELLYLYCLKLYLIKN